MLNPTQIFIHDKGGLSFEKGRAGKGYLTGWKYKGTAFLNKMHTKDILKCSTHLNLEVLF